MPSSYDSRQEKAGAGPSTPATRRGASAGSAEVKHERAATMLKKLRSDAEELLADTDRLLERLSWRRAGTVDRRAA